LLAAGLRIRIAGKKYQDEDPSPAIIPTNTAHMSDTLSIN
jgi:hypothetical protein